MRPSNILNNKTTSETYWKVQLVCIKFLVQSSLERPLKYNQNQMPLMNQASLRHFWHLLWHFIITIFGVMEILCSFRLALEVETTEEIPDSSRLEFLEKYWANNFALLDAEDNLSGSLNRGGKADLLLLRTLLAICQKYQEPSFWEMMNCFVLLAYTSLPASRTLLQRLLVWLNFTLDSEDLLCWYKWKKWLL